MQWTKWGALEPLAEISPMGLLAAGIVLGAGSPVIKKGVRGLAMGLTKGILSISDQVKETGERVSEDWRDLVAEARANRELMTQDAVGITAFVENGGQQYQNQYSVTELKEELSKMISEAREEIQQLKEQLQNTQSQQE